MAAGIPAGSAGAAACPAAGAPVNGSAGLVNGAANGVIGAVAGTLPRTRAGRLRPWLPARTGRARPWFSARTGRAGPWFSARTDRPVRRPGAGSAGRPRLRGRLRGLAGARVRRAGRRAAAPSSAWSLPGAGDASAGSAAAGADVGASPAAAGGVAGCGSAACAVPAAGLAARRRVVRARGAAVAAGCVAYAGRAVAAPARHCWTLCRVARCRASGLSPVKLPGAGGRSGPPAPRGSWSHATSRRAAAVVAAPPVRVISSCGPPGVPRPCGCGPGSRGSGKVSPTAAAAAPTASALSAPCASRVTSGGDDGARAARRRSAAKMSSGRTAGMTCRTTIRSIAFPASPPVAAHRSVSIVITAARASMRRVPLLVRRSTSMASQARNSPTARAAASGGTPGRTTSHRDASSGSAPSEGGACITSITSIPSGRAASSRSRTSDTAQALVRESSKYSASLAAPVGAAPA